MIKDLNGDHGRCANFELKRLIPRRAECPAEDGGRTCLLAVNYNDSKGIWKTEQLALGEAGCAGEGEFEGMFWVTAAGHPQIGRAHV